MARQYKTNEVKVDLASYRHYWRGVKKAGKTTLFYQLMMKLYGDPSFGLELSIGNERGYKALDGMVYDEAPDWGTLMEITEDLIENKADNNFKFICFDTVDELVEIAKREVVRLDYRKTGERHEFNACLGGYARPREKVTELINNLMTRLEDSGYGIVWIGHTKYRTVNEKNGDSYDMLTSNLSSDYDGIFANKADVVMMIDIEKEIEGSFVQGTQRYMWFRGDGFVDAGGRFSQIEQKVEFSVDNYIKTVSDAIRAEIKSRKADDKYMAEKAKQEQKEREEYYQANKEKLMNEEPEIDEYEKNVETCNDLKAEIKAAITKADTETKKSLQAQLKAAGLPTKYQNLTDPETLAKILSIVAQ
jgi:hypothetical protein